MKRKAKTKPLKCERPGCGHNWGTHNHDNAPIPNQGGNGCVAVGCACSGYVGYGPASLR